MYRTLALILTVFVAGCGASNSGRAISSENPNVISVHESDEEMNAAIAEAQATLQTFVEKTSPASPNVTNATIKVKFPYDGGDEHIWVNDVVHESGTFTGTVDEDAIYAPGVRAGQRITVTADRISDWLVVEDGVLHGGYTIKVLIRSLPPDQQNAIMAAYGVTN